MSIRRVIHLFPVTLFVALLRACGSSPGGEGAELPDGFMTLAETQAEYDATVSSFPYDLPAGVEFPERVQQPVEATVFQKGSGLVQAYQFWECSWMDLFLNDLGADTTAADTALAALEAGVNSKYRTEYMIDEGHTWTDVVIARAKLGDGSVLKDFYDSDCIWFRSETGK